MPSICYLDSETTSLLDPHLEEGRRVWEIALLNVPEDGSPAQAAVLQITDVDLTHADQVSLDVGKFDERFEPDGYGDLADYRLPGRKMPVLRWGCDELMALETISDLIAPGDTVAGSNPYFDLANLTEMYRRHRRTPPAWHYHPRDVPGLALGWLRARYDIGSRFGLDRLDSPAGDGWKAGGYSTRVIAEACGIPQPADRHSAWADTLWMAELDAVVRSVPLPGTVLAEA